jgi:plasmid stabilization system protein ParE
MPRVQIADPAKVDVQEAFSWWSENRSADQAALWYRQITEAIATLQVLPDRCPLVPESALSMSGVRQLLFGVGSHPTHRIIFVIEDDIVTILRVRHHARDEMGLGDLGGQ